MLSSADTQPKKVTIEWNKYFVNDIECERDNIYQTILDKKLYNGKVNLVRKYHFEQQEETINGSNPLGNEFANVPFLSMLKDFTKSSQKSSNKQDRSANFNLDINKFAEKCGHESEDLKTLVNKMITCLDKFYEAQYDYNNHAAGLKATIRDCITFLTSKLIDTKAHYNDIANESTVELCVFMFDLLALTGSVMSKLVNDKNFNGNINPPALLLAPPKLKEQFDDTWNDRKKSKYLHDYISSIIEQSNITFGHYFKHDLFADYKDDIKQKFDELKHTMQSLEKQLSKIDAAEKK